MEIEDTDYNAHKIKLAKVLKQKALKTEMFRRIQGYFIAMIYSYPFRSKNVFPNKLSAFDDTKSEHNFIQKHTIRAGKKMKINSHRSFPSEFIVKTQLFGSFWRI